MRAATISGMAEITCCAVTATVPLLHYHAATLQSGRLKAV